MKLAEFNKLLWIDIPAIQPQRNGWIGVSGVYCFYSKGELIYIGSSKTMGHRLYKHSVLQIASLMGYTDFTAKVLITSNPQWLEWQLIRLMKPVLNKASNPNHKRQLITASTNSH